MKPSRRASRGFSLLEVVISLAILAMSLTVLLQAQASGMQNAGRARDLTVVSLLARGKMIDIEQKLFHDGFTLNTIEEDGDFRDEGHPEITWNYKVAEVQLDLGRLSAMCDMLGGGGEKGKKGDAGGNDCEAMLGGLGASLGGFTDEIGRSLRLVALDVGWSEGKFKQSMKVHAMVTRDDFATQEAGDMQRLYNQANGGAQGQGATGVPVSGAPAAGGMPPPMPGR